jgi:proline iminopeptidase
MQFSQDTMWTDVSALDLVTTYFQVLDAPSKRLVWFEESAHEPPFGEPAKFNRAMVELVRPSAKNSSVPLKLSRPATRNP